MNRAIMALKSAARHLFLPPSPESPTAISDRCPAEFRRLFLMTFFAAFVAFYSFLS